MPTLAQQHPSHADFQSVLDAATSSHFASLYIHIPFCFHKCHYCDFYSIVDDRDRQVIFTQRLIQEIEFWSAHVPHIQPGTIFVGGGTPTLLETQHWQTLLNALHTHFDLSQLIEWTVEANPETVTRELLDVLAVGGVNRISIGAQSFNTTHLKTLERWHDPANVDRAVTLARAAGIDRINLDLIYAIPGQSLDEWHADLNRALSLNPSHLSCYALTYEPNTAMTVRRDLGRITPAEESIEAEMFETTIDRLAAGGFEHYEVSNFARPGQVCQHNMNYWTNANWLALGPSASGHAAGIRYKNRPHLGQYLVSTGPAPLDHVEQLDTDAAIGEQLMLALRIRRGVPFTWVNTHVHGDRLAELHRHLDTGFIELANDHYRLTDQGLILADAVISTLL